VDGLRKALAEIGGEDAELLFLVDRNLPDLENALDASQFRLNCTPVVNIFPRSLDRIHLSPHDTEHHVVPDLSRPMDFEVYAIDRILGIGSGGESLVEILPMYSTDHRSIETESQAYYSVQRRARLPSPRQQRIGARTNYLGSECFVSIIDAQQREFTGEIRQLDVTARCTNRDLPIGLGFSKSGWSSNCRVARRCRRSAAWRGPPRLVRRRRSATRPGGSSDSFRSLPFSERYRSRQGRRNAAAPACAPCGSNDPVAQRQVDGVRRVNHKAVVRRIPGGGPITYGRGIQIGLTLDESAFEGLGTLRLGAVLERFFARHVSINSFVETRLQSAARGEIKQWQYGRARATASDSLAAPQAGTPSVQPVRGAAVARATGPGPAAAGRGAPAAEESVRFEQPPHLTFAPSDVAAVERDPMAGSGSRSTGSACSPNGALPFHLTEFVFVRRRHHDDAAVSEFVNLSSID